MSTEIKSVKGLTKGSKVIAVTFDATALPPDGSFHGWAVDHIVSDILGENKIVLQMVSKPEKSIVFDFEGCNINCLYNPSIKPDWYTGIFTDMQIFLEQYREIYNKLKENKNKDKEKDK